MKFPMNLKNSINHYSFRKNLIKRNFFVMLKSNSFVSEHSVDIYNFFFQKVTISKRTPYLYQQWLTKHPTTATKVSYPKSIASTRVH